MKRCIAFLFISALLSSGCASTWKPEIISGVAGLQWPFSPDKAKVTHMMTLTGFRENVSMSTLFRSIAFGEGTEGGFVAPVAISIGNDKRIAIADTGCRCVHLFIPSGEQYRKISSTGPQNLISPVGVAFDEALSLYVSDSALGKILVFDRDGKFLFSFGNDYETPLKRPTGLAYNDKDKLLYIADTLENKIYAADQTGKLVFSFGERGAEKGQFNFPVHIFWSSAEIYVVDTLNFRVQVFDSSGGYLNSFGQHGDGTGDFALSKGIAVDKDGIIYVVDNLFDNVQLFDKKGNFLLTLGSRGSGQGEFWMPSGLFADNTGRLYVCDTYNRRIQVFQITENYSGEN